MLAIDEYIHDINREIWPIKRAYFRTDGDQSNSTGVGHLPVHGQLGFDRDHPIWFPEHQ